MLHSIYLAAPYGRRQYLREEIAPRLREWGHHITSSWINDPPENDVMAQYLRDRRVNKGQPNLGYDNILEHEALRDELDVCHSTMLIRFPAVDTALPSGGGKFFETGLAVGVGLIVAVIGNRECVFDYSPRVQIYPDIDGAMDGLGLTTV